MELTEKQKQMGAEIHINPDGEEEIYYPVDEGDGEGDVLYPASYLAYLNSKGLIG